LPLRLQYCGWDAEEEEDERGGSMRVHVAFKAMKDEQLISFT
jgi:hypothetical protein